MGTNHARGWAAAIPGLLLAGVLSLGGCAWVKLDPAAEAAVGVSEPGEVADCRRVGTTKARTKASIGFIKRSEAKVAEELQILARNDALELGGDTVVAEGPIDMNGVQRFIVYDCQAPASEFDGG